MDHTANHPSPEAENDLRRQVQQLQERLTFYERFDALIQDNVSHARELLRLAALERAADASGSAPNNSSQMRTELEAISGELSAMAGSLDALSQRVAAALERLNLAANATEAWQPQRAAIVVHGVASARSALSLQQFVLALPQVNGVTAREFAGGVLRLDADLAQPLQIDEFSTWDQERQIQLLTHRPDVFEVAISDALELARTTG